MFGGVRRYFWERRRNILATASLFGGAWIVGKYVIGKLEETRNKVLQDRLAKENLRKRFQQNQEDCTYHVLALLPSLGNAILEEMDVERITLALQNARSGASGLTVAAAIQQQSPLHSHSTSLLVPESTQNNAQLQLPSLSQSMISEATSGDGSSSAMDSSSSANSQSQSHPRSHSRQETSTSSPLLPNPSTSGFPEPTFDTSGLLNASTNSEDWVREFHAAHPSNTSSGAGGTGVEDSSPNNSISVTSMSLPPTEADENESVSAHSAVMVDSVISGMSSSVSGDPHEREEDATFLSRQPPPAPLSKHTPSPTAYVVPPYLANKTKAELWKEMKILAFTRALTIMYSLTLLSLLTHVQLNLIGTRKYVASVRQLAREQERGPSSYIPEASLGAMFFASPSPPQEEEFEEDPDLLVSDETERKYLTLSWWLLNVGWKDVAERVRAAVEVVFSGVSLKAQLGLPDIERLIEDVRRRVEYDGQDPSAKQRVNFLGTLIPGGEPDQEFVLLQGGLSSHDAHLDGPLRSLIHDTCAYVSSADFGVVLGLCLDRASETLLRGLREQVYEGDEEGVMMLAEVRLAALLPAVSRWSHLAVNGIPNELIETLSEMREMTAFSAILYGSYQDRL